MKKFIIALMAIAMIAPVAANAQTRVRGYYRSDGTYVQPHYRSSPNNTTSDNYSTRGNVNPYTGQAGTRDPDYRAPSTSPNTSTPRCSYNCPK